MLSSESPQGDLSPSLGEYVAIPPGPPSPVLHCISPPLTTVRHTRRFFKLRQKPHLLLGMMIFAIITLMIGCRRWDVKVIVRHTSARQCQNGRGRDASVDGRCYLTGPPTNSFQDALRNDTQYITAWSNAGWTNDVMSYVNLIYLGSISSRTPVLPPFAPSSKHIGKGGRFVLFSEIFDIPRLEASTGLPIVEWKDIKSNESVTQDNIGCWSVHQALWNTGQPAWSNLPEHLKLNITYAPIPVMHLTSTHGDVHVPFWGLASLLFPRGRENALAAIKRKPHPKPMDHSFPDEQLACFDLIYYVGSYTTFEWEHDFSPAWRFIGKHVHWNPVLEDLTERYLQRVFGLQESERVPRFISIHIRHTDFTGWCSKDVSKDECLAPLSAYARRVGEVQEELKERHGRVVTKVLVTSDETDPAWWEEVQSFGWFYINHSSERTVEKYGKWYPTLIDAVAQSMGAGFVGTLRSTMSLVAARRVEDWNGGPTRMVNWGRKNADGDH